MVRSSGAGPDTRPGVTLTEGDTLLTDVQTFTEATTTWRPLWLDGGGAVKGPAPSSGLFLSAASKLWVTGGTNDEGMTANPPAMPLKFLAATSKLWVWRGGYRGKSRHFNSARQIQRVIGFGSVSRSLCV
jgi:hypothetical protein